uniref:Uncharacterized protein n=1 Tax=Solanum lycopersicum TaxID=4081 RepID=A0A3Q7HBK6_SOLLC
MKRQTEILNREENPRFFLSTFNDLKFDSLRIIGQGLLKCGSPFLWVIRKRKIREKDGGKLQLQRRTKKAGKDIDLLLVSGSFESVSYFITHYEWYLT